MCDDADALSPRPRCGFRYCRLVRRGNLIGTGVSVEICILYNVPHALRLVWRPSPLCAAHEKLGKS